MIFCTRTSSFRNIQLRQASWCVHSKISSIPISVKNNIACKHSYKLIDATEIIADQRHHPIYQPQKKTYSEGFIDFIEINLLLVNACPSNCFGNCKCRWSCKEGRFLAQFSQMAQMSKRETQTIFLKEGTIANLIHYYTHLGYIMSGINKYRIT